MLEHLPSDFEYIKESLYHIMKYIKNKSIEQNKTNDVPDLSGISEVAWNFISAFYKSEWDSLVFDKDN